MEQPAKLSDRTNARRTRDAIHNKKRGEARLNRRMIANAFVQTFKEKVEQLSHIDNVRYNEHTCTLAFRLYAGAIKRIRLYATTGTVVIVVHGKSWSFPFRSPNEGINYVWDEIAKKPNEAFLTKPTY